MFGLNRGQRPRFEGSEDRSQTLIDRAEGVATVIELMKTDPAWNDATAESRRAAAQRLLALRWAFRNQRRGVGDTGR